MLDQISQNAVVSVKFVNSMFRMAVATSDGSFSIFQIKKIKNLQNEYSLIKLGSYHGLDELSNKVSISQLHFRGSTLM